MSLLISCREAVSRLAEFQDGVLPFAQRLTLRLHLVRCEDCRKILVSLEGLPAFLKQHMEPEAPSPEAKAALTWALEHIGQEQRSRASLAHPIPGELAPLLTKGIMGLNIQERVYKALFMGNPRSETPHVPEAALAELPALELWQWKRLPFSRIKVATLLQEAGRVLMVMVAPPHYRYPAHVHVGAESVLVLDGELEDENRQLCTGDWAYYEPGSMHAPQAGEDGCWTLVHLEGGFRHGGFLGPLRDLLN